MMVGCHSKFSNGRHEKFSSRVCVCACVYLYIYMFQKCYENIDKQLWKIRCNGVSTMRSKVRRSRKYSGLKILRLPFAVTPPCPYTCLPRIYIKKKRKKAFKRGRKLCSNRERGHDSEECQIQTVRRRKRRIIFPTMHGNIYIYIIYKRRSIKKRYWKFPVSLVKSRKIFLYVRGQCANRLLDRASSKAITIDTRSTRKKKKKKREKSIN